MLYYKATAGCGVGMFVGVSARTRAAPVTLILGRVAALPPPSAALRHEGPSSFSLTPAGATGGCRCAFFISNTYEAYHLPGLLGWYPHAHMHRPSRDRPSRRPVTLPSAAFIDSSRLPVQPSPSPPGSVRVLKKLELEA